jgi:hypothetical protein
MLYKILFKYKYVPNINLHFIETFNTDYVRHFNYVRQTDRHNLNFEVGELLYSWSESTGFRVTQLVFYKVLTLTADLKINRL